MLETKDFPEEPMVEHQANSVVIATLNRRAKLNPLGRRYARKLGQEQARRTQDFKEGIASFREKRPPVFSGK